MVSCVNVYLRKYNKTLPSFWKRQDNASLDMRQIDFWRSTGCMMICGDLLSEFSDKHVFSRSRKTMDAIMFEAEFWNSNSAQEFTVTRIVYTLQKYFSFVDWSIDWLIFCSFTYWMRLWLIDWLIGENLSTNFSLNTDIFLAESFFQTVLFDYNCHNFFPFTSCSRLCVTITSSSEL